MKSHIVLFVGILSLAATWLTATSVHAQSPYGLEPGVLVLRSGQILHGQIVRQGDSYQVLIAEGSEIRVPGRDVRLHARSLEDAYRTQRDSLAPTDLVGRLQLANWCLRAEMPHRAADQLLAVRMVDAKHEGLPAVERRLVAWEMARRAALETQTELERVEDPDSVANPYDTSELDEAVANLPTELVESFAQRVQPLLVNRCGASGCHGYGSTTEFQVMRPSFQTTFTRRYTQRNLVSALEQIEKGAPEKSPLLERAISVHGGEVAPVLIDRRNQQNDLLAEWIYAVSGGKPAPADAPVPETEKPAQVKPATKQLLQNQQRAAFQAAQALSLEASSQEASAVQAASFEEELPSQESPDGDSPRSHLSADPVDPTLFNRRYHGRP